VFPQPKLSQCNKKNRENKSTHNNHNNSFKNLEENKWVEGLISSVNFERSVTVGKTQFNIRNEKRERKRKKTKTKTEYEIPKPNPFDEKGLAAPSSSRLCLDL
jgi:hypothetical protein